MDYGQSTGRCSAANHEKFCLVACLVLFALLLSPVFACASGSDFGEQFDLSRDPDTVLQKVLSSDDFKEPAKSFIERLKEWLLDLIDRALSWLFRRAPRTGPVLPDPATARLVLGCLLLGAAAVLVHAIARVLVRVVREKRSLRGEDHEAPKIAEGLAFSASIWQQAQKQADAGDYQGAVGLLFRCVLIRLDESGKLPYHPGRTNGEVLRSLRGNEPLKAGLAGMMPFFSRVRYGNARCDRTDYERFRSQCRDLTERAVRP